MQLPNPTYLTFSQLVAKWGCENEYLHHLIFTGKIVPAIWLKKRDPDNIYSGGHYVGDTEFMNEPVSWIDYRSSTNEGDSNHHDDWPEYASLAYCHCPQSHPTDLRPNSYKFEYFSENPSPYETKVWFEIFSASIKDREDGEKRFIFTADEVERVEQLVDIQDDEKLSNIFNSQGTLPNGIKKHEVILAFDEIHFNQKQWSRNLASPSPWLENCRRHKGSKSKNDPSLWDPTAIAIDLMDKYPSITVKRFDPVFRKHKFLERWQDLWEEKSAYYR